MMNLFSNYFIEIVARLLLISYICKMKEEIPKPKYIRKAYKSSEYILFFDSLSDKIKAKFDYVLNVILTIYDVPTKFVKHLLSEDLYEMRISVGSNEYRTILFAIDHSNFIESKNIILLNCFLKKSNKDYKKHIEEALKILKRYEL